jgi:serine/threonine protein kinase/subtilisin-like proprotein convertase family protein
VTADLGPGSSFGPYRLESILGRGGMSVVYLAEDTRLGRRVAIKLLSSELAEDDAFRTRFVRESQLAAGLEHPNIVPVYEAGETDDQLYIAMRYVRGTDLRQLIVRESPLDPERAILLLRPVASALDVAHRRGLVHRDVKPANILIASDEGEEHVYLSDFGLTKHTGSHSGLTKTGQFMGTVDYVAPEQIQGQTVDGRTDGYSLACVLYECLTGRVPFAKDSDVATLFGHLQDPPPPPTHTRSGLPREIDDVVARGMAKDRDNRPATCMALVDDAARALGAPSGPKDVPYIPPAPTIAAPPPPGAPSGATTEPGVAPVGVSTPYGFPGSTPTAETPPATGARAPGNTRTLVIFGAIGLAVAAVVVILGLVVFGGDDEPQREPGPPQPPPPIAVSNTQTITIPESGQATPYPSTIEVSGSRGTVSAMTVTITGYSHPFPGEVDVLLVGPTGQSVVLMADAGGFTRARRLTVTFDDASGSSLNEDAPVAGSVRPGQFAPGFEGGSPAPSPPFGTALSAFNGTDPNGTWQLFVFDDTGGDAGQIAGGWSLDIEVGTATSPASPVAPTAPTVVSSAEAVTIPDAGQATPYPSTIEVSGLTGTISDVNATLNGLTHEFPDDVDVLLVGPTGASVILMADAGDGNAVTALGITFDDRASGRLRNSGALFAGPVQPTSFRPGFEGVGPAPAAPHGDALSVFNGTDPNGTWQLFVFDDAGGDLGQLSGWSLEITVS